MDKTYVKLTDASQRKAVHYQKAFNARKRRLNRERPQPVDPREAKMAGRDAKRARAFDPRPD
jgi:hypothetical protein